MMATTKSILRLLETALEPKIPEEIIARREEYLKKIRTMRIESGVEPTPCFHRLQDYKSVEYVRDVFGQVWKWDDYFGGRNVQETLETSIR